MLLLDGRSRVRIASVQNMCECSWLQCMWACFQTNLDICLWVSRALICTSLLSGLVITIRARLCFFFSFGHWYNVFKRRIENGEWIPLNWYKSKFKSYKNQLNFSTVQKGFIFAFHDSLSILNQARTDFNYICIDLIIPSLTGDNLTRTPSASFHWKEVKTYRLNKLG